MLETIEYRLPLPYPGPDDHAFWEGCKAHEPVAASGCGKIWSYTTTYHGFGRVWQDAVPYTVVVVQLDEGPRMTSNLVDAAPEAIKVGLPVEVVWDDVTDEVTLPKFRLVPSA